MQEYLHRPDSLSPPPGDAAALALKKRRILKAKLMPPRIRALRLRRERLLARLESNLNLAATIVAADAGSGKTTLVADFVGAQSGPYIWYQIDRADADPAVFVSYLTHGIRRVIPTFGDDVLAFLESEAGEAGPFQRQAAEILFNEILDHAEERLIIVLDDYHLLGAGTAVHSILDRLLAGLPDLIHVILISRDIPPLHTARLKSKGIIDIIDRSELLFTSEETTAIFGEVFGIRPEPGQLAEFQQRTQGWVTGLHLVHRALQRSSLVQSAVSDVWRQSEQEIFEYFAEEVMAEETPETQQILMRAALMDRLEPDLCAAIHPGEDYARIFESMLRRNTFITVAGDSGAETEYRLHPLFQTFLRKRFHQTQGQAAEAGERVRIAEEMLKRDRWDEAVNYLLEAGEFARVAEVIAEAGRRWLQAGALEMVANAVDALPAEAVERFPRAIVCRAEVDRVRGDYESAEMLLHRAVVLLRGRKDAEGEAEALHALGSIARHRGDAASALELLDRAEALPGGNSRVQIQCGNTRGLCLMSLGKWTQAEKIFRVALQAAEECGDATMVRVILHNLGLPAMLRGDFNEAIRWLQGLFPSDKTASARPHDATGHLNLARCRIYRGEFPEAEKHLECALELCRKFHLTALLGEILETYGNLRRELGQTAQAASNYDQAARAYAAAGIDKMQRELPEEQAILYLGAGEAAAARMLIEQLIEARASCGNQIGLHTARLAWSRILIALDQAQQAEGALASALDFFRSNQMFFCEAQAQAALARCALGAGRQADACDSMRRAIELATRYDYWYWLERELAEHPELLAASGGLLSERLLKTAQPKDGMQVPSRRAAGASTAPADLTIRLLGPVEIHRDPQRPLAPEAWVTRRAKEILCFISVQRGRCATRDQIIDVFWGGSEFEFAVKNLHPTISHIRRALNSNQPLRCNLLIFSEGHYRLNPEYSYFIDTEEFDRLSSEGHAARRSHNAAREKECYERAVSLYRGEFFAAGGGNWIEQKRAYYQEQYLLMIEALLRFAQQSEDWDDSLQLAERILEIDPYRENIHRLVMRAYAALGNRSAVREYYNGFRRRLKQEAWAEPEKATQALYRELVGEGTETTEQTE